MLRYLPMCFQCETWHLVRIGESPGWMRAFIYLVRSVACSFSDSYYGPGPVSMKSTLDVSFGRHTSAVVFNDHRVDVTQVSSRRLWKALTLKGVKSTLKHGEHSLQVRRRTSSSHQPTSTTCLRRRGGVGTRRARYLVFRNGGQSTLEYDLRWNCISEPFVPIQRRLTQIYVLVVSMFILHSTLLAYYVV